MRRASRLALLIGSLLGIAHNGAAEPEGPPPGRLAPSRAGFLRVHGAAAVGSLTLKERSELLEGWVVSRPLQLESRGDRAVGGVSYVLVDAPPGVVLRSLVDVAKLPELLPRTQRATLVHAEPGRQVVELTSGTALVSATYSVVLERDGEQVRFRLDPSRPAGIRDTWGFFRVQEFDGRRSLLTVAAVVDLGPGLARALFEGRVQSLILGMPDRIRTKLAPVAVARQGR